VTPTAKRTAVDCLVSEHRLSRSKACRIVDFSRSALYKPTVDWAAKDAPVIAVLNDIVAKRSRWGSAAIVTGGSAQGPAVWKNVNGKSLKDIDVAAGVLTAAEQDTE
jgi:hypothetical protein